MIVLLLLALFAAPQPDPEAARLFALGGDLYAEGDFHGATAAYEGALETGWTSPALELNLGNAYFEAGRLGYAVLHFERAHRLAPHDAAVQHNLRLARSQLADGAPQPVPPAQAAARWLARYVGAWPLAAVAFGLYLAVLALVGVRVWTRTVSPWQRRALVVLVPLALLVAGAAVMAARFESAPRAVVIAASAPLRTAPSPEAAGAGSAPEGAVLDVTARREPWLEVRLPDGSTGWAEGGVLEEL